MTNTSRDHRLIENRIDRSYPTPVVRMRCFCGWESHESFDTYDVTGIGAKCESASKWKAHFDKDAAK